MGIIDSFETCVFKKYANFKDCASLSEFWWFYAVYVTCGIILPLVGFILGDFGMILTAYFLLFLGFAVIIGLFCPVLAVSVRRLRDSNLSPWNILWHLVPYAGFIIYLVLMSRPTRRLYT